ncbi:hypothetical protein [Thermomonospora umbrina]|nr:hypothetical protein [Thermomonospora umbrina]
MLVGGGGWGLGLLPGGIFVVLGPVGGGVLGEVLGGLILGGVRRRPLGVLRRWLLGGLRGRLLVVLRRGGEQGAGAELLAGDRPLARHVGRERRRLDVLGGLSLRGGGGIRHGVTFLLADGVVLADDPRDLEACEVYR